MESEFKTFYELKKKKKLQIKLSNQGKPQTSLQVFFY
jgi:hypothetical protein